MASSQPLSDLIMGYGRREETGERMREVVKGREGEGGREGQREMYAHVHSIAVFYHILLFIFSLSSDVEVTTQTHD